MFKDITNIIASTCDREKEYGATGPPIFNIQGMLR
jgi:hypothetical protein